MKQGIVYVGGLPYLLKQAIQYLTKDLSYAYNNTKVSPIADTFVAIPPISSYIYINKQARYHTATILTHYFNVSLIKFWIVE